MFGLNLLQSAISRLAGSFNSLADTADEINADVRRRAALDAPDILDTPALLPAPPAVAASTLPQDATSPEVAPPSAPPSRNGRKRAVEA